MKGDDFKSIVNVFPCQVQWGDCDPAGIIFYPTYFRWIDAASWALFDAVGYSPVDAGAALAMPSSAECQFLPRRTATEVRSRIARFGGSRSWWSTWCAGRHDARLREGDPGLGPPR